MSRRIFGIVGVALLAAVSASGAAVAEAPQKAAKTKITIKDSCPGGGGPACRRVGVQVVLSGKVKSKVGKCTRGRAVRVFQEDDGPDTFVGEDTSDGDGKWSLEFLGGNQRYYAKSKKVTKGGTVCKAGRSPKEMVDQVR